VDSVRQFNISRVRVLNDPPARFISFAFLVAAAQSASCAVQKRHARHSHFPQCENLQCGILLARARVRGRHEAAQQCAVEHYQVPSLRKSGALHGASNNEVRRDTVQTRDVGFKQSSDELTSLKKLARSVAAGISAVDGDDPIMYRCLYSVMTFAGSAARRLKPRTAV